MKRSLAHLLAIVTPVVLLAACGGGGGSTGSSNTGGTGGGGSGTAGSTSPNGGGGSGTAGSTATNGGGGSGGSPTTTTSTGGSTSSGAMGACINAADGAVLQQIGDTLEETVGKCAQDNFAQEPATYECIKNETGLSAECAQCFDDTVQCAFMNCLNPCLADQNGQECKDCRAMYCDGPFQECSGIDPSAN